MTSAADQLVARLGGLRAARFAADERYDEHRRAEPPLRSREWLRVERRLYAEKRDRFRDCNQALAEFLGGRVSDKGFDLETLTRKRAALAWREDTTRVVMLDHHGHGYVRAARGERALAIISHPYGWAEWGVFEIHGPRLLARRLTLPSWYAESASVVLVMRSDAPQWALLEPLLPAEMETS